MNDWIPFGMKWVDAKEETRRKDEEENGKRREIDKGI